MFRRSAGREGRAVAPLDVCPTDAWSERLGLAADDGDATGDNGAEADDDQGDRPVEDAFESGNLGLGHDKDLLLG